MNNGEVLMNYEWLSPVKEAERMKRVAPLSVSVIMLAKAGEPYTIGGYSGSVPECYVWLALVGPQEGIDQLWRDYHAED